MKLLVLLIWLIAFIAGSLFGWCMGTSRCQDAVLKVKARFSDDKIITGKEHDASWIFQEITKLM